MIKVSEEEALEPMRKEVLDAIPESMENIKEILKRSKNKEKVLIIGVGNTCGIGNSIEDTKDVEKKIRSHKEKPEKKKNIIGI